MISSPQRTQRTQRREAGMTEAAQAVYPQHDKLRAVRDQSQAIGEFLEWLQSTRKPRVTLTVDAELGMRCEDLWPKTEDLLAEYFGIDRAALECEKQAMIKGLRDGKS
jgi:hypothetical protein